MRTIKFRAWDKDRKTMITSPNRLHIGFSEGTPVVYDMKQSGDLINCELMQFTGLLSKSGKPIFEGDILKNKWKDGFDSNDSIGVVIWSEEFAGWALKDDVGIFHLNHHPHLKNKHEVIGNIYENPDLLNDKNI